MAAYRLQFARKKIDISGRETCVMFGAEQGHDDLAVSWWMLPAGCTAQEEPQDRARAVIVLSGRARAVVEGQADDLGAGHAVYVPRGSAWSLENVGREPLVCYAVSTPA